MQPTIIEGGISVDDRGTVSFVNGFPFKNIKRFYRVENFSTDVVRAFHGHKKEGKFVFVAKGSALVCAVPFDDEKASRTDAAVQRFTLSERKPSILSIPPGFANGFRSLEPGTVLLFFSTDSLEESKGDDYRFPADHWGSHVWSVEHR